MARIGVYVCHCGTNIAGTVDVGAVRDFAAALPGVVVARDYQYMCSDPGQDLIRKDIAEMGLDRVVVASCSPRMHEPTFRRALESAGLNGYLLEMANIREHVSWVTTDVPAATRKAKALVAGAVRRVALHQPLEERYADVTPQALVVGGGIAGIEAALKIADGGFRVHLVEKEPSIGGQMAKLDKTFPTLDCSACILTPKMVAVAQHPNIVLHTYSEVERVDGFVGNFRVTIRHKARSVDMQKCTGCGTCWSKCPYTAPNEFDEGLGKRKLIYIPFPQAVPNKPVIDRERCVKFQSGKCGACQKLCPTGAIDFNQQDELVEENFGAIIVATGYSLFDPGRGPWGYGRYPNVLTALQFERMVNASGPTGGHVQLQDGSTPRAVAILHCIGSRDTNYHEYCSNVCCMYSLKLAHLIKEKTGAEVYNFYIDIRAFGKAYEEFYNRVQNEGVYFIRGKGAEVGSRDGRLVVRCEDTLLGKYREIPVDMVILSPAMEPRPDAARISQVFGIQRSADGFFLEAHAKLEPLKTATDGVFIAGACQGPKDIPYSVAQGAGAAAEVLRLLSAGRVTISPVVAQVADEICSGCRACLPICPYHALTYDEGVKVVRVNEALCKGCGTCVAACPSGALSVSHFRTPQVLAQIEEVLAV
ncbi:MAG: CoB--CoM heterodisulfide reductase iron-sulfur subunit A family protein [Bacillota bacterium]